MPNWDIQTSLLRTLCGPLNYSMVQDALLVRALCTERAGDGAVFWAVYEALRDPIDRDIVDDVQYLYAGFRIDAEQEVP